MMKKFFLLFIPLFFVSCAKDKNFVQEKIERIVVLSPSGCEILFALDAGSNIIARTEFCTQPKEALDIESIGGFDGKSLSAEKIISCKPDFVYGSSGMHDFLKESLKQFGIKTFFSSSSSVQDIFDEIQAIGKILNKNEEAENLVKKINDGLDEVKKSPPFKTAYFEVWNEPFMSAGNSSFINELLFYAGYENIFSSINSPYPMVSEEEIILKNPEVIFVPRQNGTSIEKIKSRAGWENINAVKNNRIFLVDADIVSRPGPNLVSAVRHLISFDAE